MVDMFLPQKNPASFGENSSVQNTQAGV